MSEEILKSILLQQNKVLDGQTAIKEEIIAIKSFQKTISERGCSLGVDEIGKIRQEASEYEQQNRVEHGKVKAGIAWASGIMIIVGSIIGSIIGWFGKLKGGQ